METITNKSVKASWDVMINHLQEDTHHLFESEKELLRTEINEKLAEVKLGISSLLVAVSLILVGVFSLVATSIILLNQFIPLLKASGIVSGALMVGGILFLKIAQRRFVSVKTETKGDEYTENLN